MCVIAFMDTSQHIAYFREERRVLRDKPYSATSYKSFIMCENTNSHRLQRFQPTATRLWIAAASGLKEHIIVQIRIPFLQMLLPVLGSLRVTRRPPKMRLSITSKVSKAVVGDGNSFLTRGALAG